ncbi:hypothetical protein DRN58_01940 [Thermococci archaeon]|nr:MAG: hypothetical protein DRN58_01940 [Thermococci archaeon]
MSKTLGEKKMKKEKTPPAKRSKLSDGALFVDLDLSLYDIVEALLVSADFSIDISDTNDRRKFCDAVDEMLQCSPEIFGAVGKIADIIYYGSSVGELSEYKVYLVPRKEMLLYDRKTILKKCLDESYIKRSERDLLKLRQWEEDSGIKDFLPEAIEDLVKYGDGFLESKNRKVYYLPSNEITWDIGRDGRVIRYYQWRDNKKKPIESKIYHFSLSAIPPGKSMLYPLVRSWRYLKLLEEAILIYRISRAAQKLVFYIDVTGKDTEEAKEYIKKWATIIKNKLKIDLKKGLIRGKNSIRDILDIVIPKTPDSATQVDVLSSDATLTDVPDVKFIQRRILAALDIPKAYLNYEESTRNRDVITKMEINFSRTIRKYQKKIARVLVKLYEAICVSFNIDIEKYAVFIHFPPPSLIDDEVQTQATLQKAKVLTTLQELLPQLPVSFIIKYVFPELSSKERADLIKVLEKKLEGTKK